MKVAFIIAAAFWSALFLAVGMKWTLAALALCAIGVGVTAFVLSRHRKDDL